MNNHKGSLIAAVAKAARMAETLYKQANPDAGSLKVRTDVAAYRPRPKELRNASVRAVELFLGSRSYLDMNNKEIAAYLSRDVPGYDAPTNLLTEQFTPGEKKAVTALLSQRGKLPIDLQRNDTPSKVKLALRARNKGEGSRKLKVTATFSTDAVTIGDRLFPVTIEGGVSRIRLGKYRINVAALQALLDPV